MVIVRQALRGDRYAFRALLRLYLEEVRQLGSEVLPTPRTMKFFLSLFDDYLSGSTDGAVLMVGDVAFTMAGEAPFPYDTDFGKTALGWGTFVVPAERKRAIATVLRLALQERLRSLGFETLIGGVHSRNTTARDSMAKLNWTPYQVNGFTRLGQE